MCFDGIYQGMYNIEVYDILNSHNGSMTHSRQPQVLSNIEIEGIPCIQTTGMIVLSYIFFDCNDAVHF